MALAATLLLVGLAAGPAGAQDEVATDAAAPKLNPHGGFYAYRRSIVTFPGIAGALQCPGPNVRTNGRSSGPGRRSGSTKPGVGRPKTHRSAHTGPRAPVSLLAPLRFQAAADLLSSPLVGLHVRGGIVDYETGLDRVTVREGQTDPNGRPATLLSTPDLARQRLSYVIDLKKQGKLRLGRHGGYSLRKFNVLRGTHVARELLVDPRSNDILATRSILTATNNKSLARWLQESGGPQVLEQRVFRRASLKQRPDLARRPFRPRPPAGPRARHFRRADL